MRAPSLSPEALVRAGHSHAGKGLPWFARTPYTAPYGITRELPALVALDPYGRVYFNLPYLKDLADRVEAQELPLEEALEDGRNPPNPPPAKPKNAHNLGASRG